MEPTVSYVIPAFRAEDSLGAAIGSVLAQRDARVEVVVVDDASGDGTSRVAREVGDPRVRLVELEANRGPGGARNAGLAAATGDWVAILDADDSITPGRTRALLARAQATGADVVVDNLLAVDGAGRSLRLMFSAEQFRVASRLTPAQFIDGNRMLERSRDDALGYLKPMLRRSLVQRAGLRYREELRIGEDFYFLAEALAHAGYAATEPEPGYRYQVRPGSISSDLALENVLGMRRADDDLRRDVRLDDAAVAALARRTRSLDSAISYLRLRDALRRRALTEAAAVARADPLALRHLRIPVEAKVRRTLARAPRGGSGAH